MSKHSLHINLLTGIKASISGRKVWYYAESLQCISQPRDGYQSARSDARIPKLGTPVPFSPYRTCQDVGWVSGPGYPLGSVVPRSVHRNQVGGAFEAADCTDKGDQPPRTAVA